MGHSASPDHLARLNINASRTESSDDTVPSPLGDAEVMGSVPIRRDMARRLAEVEISLRMERSARKAAEARLLSNNRALSEAGISTLETQRRLELALWANGESIWEWEERSDAITIQSFHKDPTDIANILPSRLRLTDYLEYVHRADREAVRLAWNLLSNGLRTDIDLAHRACIGNRTRWLRLRGRRIESSPLGSAKRMIGTLKDITQQRQADQSLRLMAHAFTSSPDAMVVTNARWDIVEANGSFYDLVKIVPASGLRPTLTDFMDVDTLVDGVDPMVRLWRREATLIDAGGMPVPVDVTISSMSTAEDSGICRVIALRDISERKRAAARLQWFAHYDPLTELMNRTALKEHLDRQLSTSPDEAFALLFIDLDGFKEVNDSLGHNNGDALLKEIALRLQEVLSHRAIVARWGGDEFVVMIHPPSGSSEALEVTQRLVARLAEPIAIAAHEVTITPSIGVALAPRDGRDASTLLRRADSAMYAAKDAGRNRCEFYRSDLDADLLQRMQLNSLLRLAADRNDFHFVAQPKTSYSGTVVGAELLVRWHSEALGDVPASTFVPLAEEIGVIGQIGRLALDRAAELAARLASGARTWSVSVNLSSRQVADPQLERHLLEACRKHGIEPRQLELEVTESAFIGNVAAARQVLNRLHDLGFPLSLDDFGTGYSALSYLRDLPFDKIKIDRSFVRDIDTDLRARALVEGMIALCRTLGMMTVAEGVETLGQRDELAQMGIDEYQGYLYARPMPLAELLRLDAPLQAGGPASLPRD